MVTEKLMDIFFGIFAWIIDKLSSLDLSIPDDVFSNIVSIFSGINYFLPLKFFVPIFVFELALFSFKMTLAVLRLIKSFIPGLGG